MVACRASHLGRACTFAAVASVVLGGCGGSSSHKVKKPASPLATVCTAGGRAAIAGFVGVQAATVSERASISSQSYPQCVYRVPGAAVQVTVIVDNGPQPFFRLERTAVEAQQVFSSVRNEPAPVQVPHLGLDADWFPGEHQMMTTDGRRLITAQVNWRRAKGLQRQRLASVAARAYLGPLRHNPAQGY